MKYKNDKKSHDTPPLKQNFFSQQNKKDEFQIDHCEQSMKVSAKLVKNRGYGYKIILVFQITKIIVIKSI